MKKRALPLVLSVLLLLTMLSFSASAKGGTMHIVVYEGVEKYLLSRVGDPTYQNVEFTGDYDGNLDSGQYTLEPVCKQGYYCDTAMLDDNTYPEFANGKFTFSHDTVEQTLTLFGGKLSYINWISVTGIETPKAGQTAGSMPEPTVPPLAEYTIVDYFWRCASSPLLLNDDDVFEAGETYQMCIVLTLDQHKYVDDKTMWRLNNGLVDEDFHGYDESDGTYYIWTKPVIVTARLEKIEFIGGAKPEAGRYSGLCLQNVAVPEGARYSIDDIYWYCVDTNTVLTYDEVMVPERSYYLYIRFELDAGFAPKESAQYLLTGDFPAVAGSGYSGGYGNYGYIRSAPVLLLDRVAVSWYTEPGGTPAGSCEISRGSLFPEPEIPEKHGYIFAGWYTDYAKTIPYDSTEPVMEDLKLYAKWEPADYISSFRLDGFGSPVIGERVNQHNLIRFRETNGSNTTRFGTEGYGWYDVTGDKVLGDYDVFEEGHTYQQFCMLKAADDCYLNADTVCRLYAADGTPVEADKSKTYWRGTVSSLPADQAVYQIYTLPQTALAAKNIDVIQVTSFGSPVLGETAKDHNTLELPRNASYYFDTVGWFDMTEGSWMTDEDVFLGDHLYSQGCILKPLDGWRFSEDTVLDSEVPTDTEMTYWGGSREGDPDMWFVFSVPSAGCGMSEIRSVGILNYKVPEAGQTAADLPAVTVPEDADYRIGTAYWVDFSENCYLAPGEPFLTGHEYVFCCLVEAKDGFYFTEETVCSVNNGSVPVDASRSGWLGMEGFYENELFYVAAKPVTVGKEALTLTDTLALEMDLPGIGEEASARNTPGIPEDACYYVTESFWYNETAGVKVYDSDIFNETDEYVFCCAVKFNPGFGLSDGGSVVYLPAGGLELDADRSDVETTRCILYSRPVKAVTVCPTHEHSYTETVTAPTCTEKGYTTHTCACGDSYKDTYVDALGHNYVNGVCSRCGAKDPNYKPIEPDKPCDGGASCPGKVFTDMPKPSNWAHAGIDFCVENGLFAGTSATTFSPDGNMTRAMLVTVLYRLEGQPAVTASNPFSDVANGQWYTNAVVWAAGNGVVNGVGDGKFDPDANITREQMAAILYRYAQKKGFDTSARADLKTYPDYGEISAYARDALSWANVNGLINGTDGTNGQTILDPQGNATRAQVAAILMRYVKNIAEAK